MLQDQGNVTLYNNKTVSIHSSDILVIAEDCLDASDVAIMRKNIKKLKKGTLVSILGLTSSMVAGKCALVLFEGIEYYVLTKLLLLVSDYNEINGTIK